MILFLDGFKFMNILIISIHFHPENFKINSIASELAKKNKVTILTGKPNYPDGKLFENYSLLSLDKETFNRCKIIRVPIFLRGNRKAYSLALNYLSFIISSIIFGSFLLRKKKFDNIIVFGTSPLIQGITGVFFKFLKKAKLNLWVLDLWPEDLINTGYVKNNFILKLNRYLSKFLYFFSDKIFVSSKYFSNHIKKNYNKLSNFIPNPYDLIYENRILPNQQLNLPFDFKKNEDIILSFAGNIGNNQGLEVIIKSCEIINHKNIKFLIFGSGNKLEHYKNYVKTNKVKNIFFMGRYPKEVIKHYFYISSALIVSLNNRGSLPLTLPGKISDYLISRKPLICSADGQASDFVKELNCGLTSSSNNPHDLAKNILIFYKMSEKQKKLLANNGYEYAKKYLNPSKISSDIIKLIL